MDEEHIIAQISKAVAGTTKDFIGKPVTRARAAQIAHAVCDNLQVAEVFPKPNFSISGLMDRKKNTIDVVIQENKPWQ